MEKLVLIDGNSLINRAFYATPPLTDKNGAPTNAVYGFVNMLIKIITDVKPKYMVVAFDVHAKTFRHNMYDAYKATRKPMPEDLRPQIPLLKKVLNTMGIQTFEKAGIEADDIIGTLAKRYKGETIIYTGDKDSFQLVDETTSVYFTRRGITDTDIYNIENFKEKTQIEPLQIIDLKACMGDSSDNIPGIVGVGEKTALDLVTKYGSLENVYQNLDDFKGKLKEKIENGKELAFLSKTLATINTFVEIPLKVEDATFGYPFKSEVKRLFSELDFRTFLKRSDIFDGESEENLVQKEIKIVDITSENDFFSIPLENEITLSIGSDVHIYLGKENEYVLKVKETFFDQGFEFEEAVKILKTLVENPKNKIICHSVKRLSDLLFEFGINVNAQVEDVDIMRYLVDFNGYEESLDELIYYYGKSKQTPAYSLYEIYLELSKKIVEHGVQKLYREVELPLSKVLTEMERDGFKVDLTALQEIKAQYKAKLDELAKKINEYAGQNLNPNSPKQIGEVIYGKLNLTAGKKNKNGNYSTNAETLEEIADLHPIIPLILEHRTAQKLYSSYLEGMGNLIDKETGLVHTSFNQTLTQTGRLSSKEPNLQNIPVRDEQGRELRKLFIPRAENRVLVDADYSQIELRLLAHFSECQILIDAYNSDKDIHALTASQVFNVPLSEVTGAMRSKAKAVNFGIIYGISEYGLSKNLKISAKEAREYISKYFEMYPSVKEYMDGNVEFAKKYGFVSTLLNRRRYIKEINSPNFNLRSFGERASKNMPLQGSSADIIKVAMVKVSERLKKECSDSKLILQVHDELIVDALESEVDKVVKIVKEEMENAVSLKVPLTVDIKVGKSWFETK
ncbi:MAG: DNA polymerase I [Clostridia bacterium]|nr:DNA polymerase I [Clostridia bacterium]